MGLHCIRDQAAEPARLETDVPVVNWSNVDSESNAESRHASYIMNADHAPRKGPSMSPPLARRPL